MRGAEGRPRKPFPPLPAVTRTRPHDEMDQTVPAAAGGSSGRSPPAGGPEARVRRHDGLPAARRRPHPHPAPTLTRPPAGAIVTWDDLAARTVLECPRD